MQRELIPPRVRAGMAFRTKRLQLELARRRQPSSDVFVDYGWIKLLYSGDGDAQEVFYHQHQKEWAAKDLHVFSNLLAPGQTAVDVGANLGFVSLMFAAIVGRQGRVVACEPSPSTFAKLTKTLAANRAAQVTALNVGCGATADTVRLNKLGRNSGNASIVAAGTDSIEIQIRPLDEIAEVWKTPVSLLKIDTEGYEPEVLRGAQRLLAEHRPKVYLEMGGNYTASTLQTIELLDAAGYGVDHVRHIDWDAVGNGSDYFFFPRC